MSNELSHLVKIVLVVITESLKTQGLNTIKVYFLLSKDQFAVDWETLLHIVIQGPRLMEVLPPSTCSFYRYLNVPSISSQQTGEGECEGL